MSRKLGAALAALLLVALALPLSARAAPPDTVDDCAGVLCVGYGAADATWHVGTGGGQYADKGPATTDGDNIDPQQHSLAQTDSYGVASRLSMRAIVLQGANGTRMAMVKSDNYLAQNHLLRRVGQLLKDAGSTITTDRILHSASHNHNSPYYSTPSWGVFVFQDVMDLRAFEYQARAISAAILDAEASMQPARMGATTVHHDVFKGNIAERGVSEDGTPFGFPVDFGDLGVTVMRFEALDGTPIAAWANWGQHPESLDGYDLITADYLGPLQRMIERQTGAPLVFSQGDVGSSEGPYYPRDYNPVLPDGVIKAWAHVGHAQMERGARYLADAIAAGWDRIGAGVPTDENPVVAMSGDVPVDMITYWAPGPVSHPYPTVGNCRSNQTLNGNPGAPGAPDCERAGTPTNDLLTESLRMHDIPVPEGYGSPGHGAVEENYRLQLQAVRIGEVILGSCSCEAQADLILNFESRANKVELPDHGDIWDGYPWDEQCTANTDTTWTCPNPDGGTSVVSDAAYQHMKAQIHNDAAGWDAPEYAPYANSEPSDPTQIKGNFTKEELGETSGYTIAVGLGHTGDYNGYTVSYRQYMSGDYYRKSLTAYGPHTADYMVTRLVRMAQAMKTGEPFVPDDILGPFAAADEARQEALSQALGRSAGAAYDGWHAALPSDVGPAAIVTEPKSISRFDAATVEWLGGSNAVDNPTVRVERMDGNGAWQPFADQSGEIQTELDMPDGVDGVVAAWAGEQEWHWTAGFEAFDAFPATLGQVPDGTYRFVVDGMNRQSLADMPYHLESAPFDVEPWAGITLSDLQVDDGEVSFVVDPIAYPRTYQSVFPYVRDDGDQRLCKTCSFRPWASTGEAVSVTVKVIDDSDTMLRTTQATLGAGRWTAATALQPGEWALIDQGDVRDTWGETNGLPYSIAAAGGPDQDVSVGGGESDEVGDGGLPIDTDPISSSRSPLPIAAGLLALVVLATIARKVTR